MDDVTFTGASGQSYTLNFGTNAACRIEAATNRSYDEVMAELRGTAPKVTTIREWVRASLVAPKDVSLDDVGNIIDDLGGWTFVLVGLGSQSPTAVSANEAIRDALSVIASLKPTSEEPVTH